MAELRTGGEWVVEVLRAQGVRHVFGLPGVHNLAIYDALLRQRDIAHVLSRHEQGARNDATRVLDFISHERRTFSAAERKQQR